MLEKFLPKDLINLCHEYLDESTDHKYMYEFCDWEIFEEPCVVAAKRGYMDLMEYGYDKTVEEGDNIKNEKLLILMYLASLNNQFELVKWCHENIKGSYTEFIIENSIINRNLEMFIWCYGTRKDEREFCHVLLNYRREVCRIIDNELIDFIEYLVNIQKISSSLIVDRAIEERKIKVLIWIIQKSIEDDRYIIDRCLIYQRKDLIELLRNYFSQDEMKKYDLKVARRKDFDKRVKYMDSFACK